MKKAILFIDGKIRYLGITGDDLFDEYSLRSPSSLVEVLETFEWFDKEALFGRPTLCMFSKDKEMPKGNVNIAFNKKYEKTTELFLKEASSIYGFGFKMNAYSGGTEETVASGINDFGIDIVYSGRSLEKNGLCIVEKVRSSDLVAIGVNERSPKIFEREFNMLKERLVNPSEDSYSSKLMSSANSCIKKIGEESAELISALRAYDLVPSQNNREDLIGEFADYLFAASTGLVRSGIAFDDVAKILYQRQKKF